MLIEDTLNELITFAQRFYKTLKHLIFRPLTAFSNLRNSVDADYIEPKIFFLINCTAYIILDISFLEGRDIAKRISFNSVINHIEQYDSISIVERAFFIAIIFLIVYAIVLLIGWLLRLKANERNLFQNFVLYYISLNLFIYNFLLLYTYYSFDNLSVGLFHQDIVTLKTRDWWVSFNYKLFWVAEYVLAPGLYLIAVFYELCKKKALLTFFKYLATTLLIIFSVDLINHIHRSLATTFNPRQESIFLKGGMNYKENDNASSGLVEPYFIKDSTNKSIHHSFRLLKFDVYFFNHSDSSIIIPKNTALYVRLATKNENDILSSGIATEENDWDRFDQDNCLTLNASDFENKSEKYMIIKPDEIKWVTFVSAVKDTNAYNSLQRFFYDLNTKVCRCRVFRPSANNTVNPQWWISHNVTQTLVFDYHHFNVYSGY